MRLILASLLLAVILGYLLGGRLSRLGHLRIRWQPVAIVGLGLQVAPVPGRVLPMILLYLSFVLLLAFAVVNVRAGVPGSWLIAIGILLNFVVIGVNQGMPVTRGALVASGQQSTLTILVNEGGAKHHLAAPGDHFVFLGDIVAIHPLRMAASPGDLIAYAGVVWLIVAAMLGRAAPLEGHRRRAHPEQVVSPGGARG
jgi:hypothetical protein